MPIDRESSITRHVAEGEAALLLVASLIHQLIEEGQLARVAALHLVSSALDVQVDQCDERGENPASDPSVIPTC